MQPEVAKRLLDALKATVRIREFVAGKSFRDFSQSELLRSAVERQFEIVGEALGRAAAADSAVAQLMPELPRIVGLRNRLIHGYDSVDDEIIWDIVTAKIGPLAVELERILTEAGFTER